MSDRNSSSDTLDPRLNHVLTEYLEAVERGGDGTVLHWVNRYPEFASELREFIDGHHRLNAVVAAAGAAATLAGNDVQNSNSVTSTRLRYFGDYELIEEIARGGMGVVFRGRQVSLNRSVAVKMILSGELASPDDVARFRLEAEAAANLDHPGIVPIYEIGESDGQHYFSMKYIEGQSLAARLKQRTEAAEQSSLSIEEIRQSVRLLAEVARAVHYAHQRGIIHRDLKPANILIDANGRPHVTDFGLAKRVTGDSELTRTGAIIGTPSFMPPEQAGGGNAAVTTAADIYGLGAILFAALTGSPPFEGHDPLDTLQRVRTESPRKASSLSPRVDRDLDLLCDKCLAKNPEDRYRSAGELADDLDRWLSGESLLAAPLSAATVIWRWFSANFGVTAAVLVLGVVTGWLVIEPARWTQAHNVGSYLGVYRGSFSSIQPPEMLESLAEYSRWWGIPSFLVGLGCYFSMGWWSDWLVRPKSSGTAALTGFALGSTAAVTAFFGGVGWTTLSQHAVWPIHADLEVLAATIDNDATFSGGQRLSEMYPGVPARRVMKKALADLETNIPVALRYGLLFSVNLLLLPAIVQTQAAYLMRQRGDGSWQRLFYLVELSVPLAVVLGGGGYLIYYRPWLVMGMMAFGVVAWLSIESTRRWIVSARRGAFAAIALAGIIGLCLAVDVSYLFSRTMFGGGPGGNSPALYMVAAMAAASAIVQRWPWWRYGVYAIWVTAVICTFTGPGLTFPNTPMEIASSIRNSHVGMLLVLVLTGVVACYGSAKNGKPSIVARVAAKPSTVDLARRRILIKRWGVATGIMLLVAVTALVPAIRRQIREQQLVEVIDQMQPESIAQIKSLVAAGADVRTRGHDNTVAMVAAFRNDPELLRMALSAGVDPNAADPFGNTALHFSSFAPSVEPLRLLLAVGSNVNVQNKRGETPLMLAVRNAQFDQIKLLLAAGSKVDVVSQSGETALSIAKSLKSDGPRPMRPDLTANDFVRLLNEASDRGKH